MVIRQYNCLGRGGWMGIGVSEGVTEQGTQNCTISNFFVKCINL